MIKIVWIRYKLFFPVSIMGRMLLVAHFVKALRYKPEDRGFDS
jgi:hypothetical protein